MEQNIIFYLNFQITNDIYKELNGRDVVPELRRTVMNRFAEILLEETSKTPGKHKE